MFKGYYSTPHADVNNNKLSMNLEDLTRAGWRLMGKECSENQVGVRLQRVCGFLQMGENFPFFFLCWKVYPHLP